MPVNYTFSPLESAPLDPGAKRKHKPKVLTASFGDEYSQRAADGINNNPAERDFSWTNLTEEEKDYIDEFFTARNGWQSFYYDHKGSGQPLVYVCTEWEVEDVTYDVYNVSASFKQVYDI